MTFTRHHFSIIYYNIYMYVYVYICVPFNYCVQRENISKGVFFCVHLHAELYKNKNPPEKRRVLSVCHAAAAGCYDGGRKKKAGRVEGLNKIDGIVKSAAAAVACVYSANAARKRRESFTRWKWTSCRAVTGPAILSTLILISISYFFYFYFNGDLIRFCFIVPLFPTDPLPSESKVKNGRKTLYYTVV